MSKYPELIIDLKKLKNNVDEIKKRCDKFNVKIAGVIKGCSGYEEVAKLYDDAGFPFIASARMEQLKPLKGKVKAELMMIRIPMISETDEIVKYTDVSLNSEVEVLKSLNKSAKENNVIHKVILMKDLGDLREGFFSDDELVEAAQMVEEMSNLHLLGIGTNLGCYGAIEATREKMEELVQSAYKVEEKIGRKLEYVSGGATSSLARVIEGDMPGRINLLRVGEGILLANICHYDLDYLYKDVFTLRCEVIEVKDKPTHPIGHIMFDSFGKIPTYEDKGIRRRALLAIGRVDYAFLDDLKLFEEGAYIIGASSDHTIIDIEDTTRDIKVGDIMEFGLAYSNLVYVSNSPNINKVFKK